MKRFLPLLSAITLTAQAQLFPGEATPVADAELFSGGKITTLFDERDFAISPDGTEIFYTLMISSTRAKIITRKLVNGKWQPAQQMPFSGAFHDIEPALSPDGNKLFFASTRTTGSAAKNDHDIWVSTRQPGGWSVPINLGSPVNTAQNEYYPSVATNGTLYWTANYANGSGDEDIWYATFNGSTYATPALAGMNTSLDEFNAFVDPGEQFILYSVFTSSGIYGHGDLYISRKTAGVYGPGALLNQNINSNALDYSPYVTLDKRFFFFTSERALTAPDDLASDLLSPRTIFKRIAYPRSGSNIYWMDFEKVN